MSGMDTKAMFTCRQSVSDEIDIVDLLPRV